MAIFISALSTLTQVSYPGCRAQPLRFYLKEIDRKVLRLDGREHAPHQFEHAAFEQILLVEIRRDSFNKLQKGKKEAWNLEYGRGWKRPARVRLYNRR